jgi:hypothetical protein
VRTVSKTKPWLARDENTAHCNRCGGQSTWKDGISFRGHALTYWRWWGNFRKTHGSCPYLAGVDLKMPYFECHITIEPVFEERLVLFKRLCASQDFRVAELLMQKRKSDTPERSKYDTFCTGHSATYEDLKTRMLNLLVLLRASNFEIWRYKIEDCVLDSREDASLFPVNVKPKVSSAHYVPV